MTTVSGVGLGYRHEFQREFHAQFPSNIDFIEIAPENWIHVGGRRGKMLQAIAEKYPIICHGLSLSIGGPDPLNVSLLEDIKHFMAQHYCVLYSEHLSYCTDGGQLYDLLPIPFTEEAIHYVANRIKQVQDILEQPIIMENISYYATPGQELTELEFINAVLAETNCHLLLDVNNIYVNSINHYYDAENFLINLKAKHIAYVHIAGHHQEKEGLMIDTHGNAIIEPVWQLLKTAYQHFGIMPTLLERDFNFPPFEKLLAEIDRIHCLQKTTQEKNNA